MFYFKKSNNSEPADCFVLTRLISGYCPTSFEILYLSWERPFINILLIFACCSLVSYLLSGPAPHGISQHTGSLLFASLPHDWTASLKKTREPGNIFETKWLQKYEAAHVILGPDLYTILKRKRILAIYSQVNAPLFCDSSRSSISASFRGMKLIRKGQRASHLQELKSFIFSAYCSALF